MGRQMGVVIALLFAIPILVKGALLIIQSMINPAAENIEEGGELIASAATPWWLSVLEGIGELHLALPLTAVVVIALIFFLKWVGEIR